MMLRIGQVAQRTGFSVEAIRYYQRLGLIAEASRTASGYRQFEPGVVRRLEFVRRAQALGFSLEEIRELLELRLEAGGSAPEVRKRAEAKLRDVRAKIADLDRMRTALEALTRACRGAGSADECPILQALDGPGEDADLERRAGESGAPWSQSGSWRRC